MRESPQALLLDRAARRYGTRPSVMLGIQDRALALDLDCALAIRAQAENDAVIDDASGDDEAAFFVLVVTLLRLMT